MLLIKCPYCKQARNEIEFFYGGEAYKNRPLNPDELDDYEWADFLYYQKDGKGLYLERWYHSAGCRKWFNVARDTTTSEIKESFRIDAPMPELNYAKPAY